MNWPRTAADVRFEARPFVGGDYQAQPHLRGAVGEGVFTTVNPVTEGELAIFSCAGEKGVDQAVKAARKAFDDWRLYSPDRRKAVLLTVADSIERERGGLALLDTLEMGMPISMALQEVDDAAGYLRYYAEFIDKDYGEVAAADPSTTLAFSAPEPRGVIGVITPWNFPLMTAMAAIAPALAAGNCLVVKPSEQAPSSVLKLAEIAAAAGLPAGVLNVVPGTGARAGAALASHNDVDKLHFTGSTQVGRKLMVYAGQSNGKPVMLELGGKSPQIVFDDAADLPNLGAAVAQSAFYNTGQLCVAKSRLLVHERVKEPVIEAIKAEIRNVFTIGDPLNETTNYGPIASRQQLERVKSYLNLGEKEQGKTHALTIAGEVPKSGFFLKPVLIDCASHAARIAQEEIFGPVLSVISFNSDDEAIQLANDVEYGLAATAWTTDLARARRLSRDLNAGDVSICATTVPASPTAGLSMEPFGASGHGVIGGRRGLEPYQRIKAVQFITDAYASGVRA